MDKRTRKMDPNSLPNRTLEFMKEPGVTMVSTTLAQLLDVTGKDASMLLSGLWIKYPDMIKRRRLYNTKEGQSRWEYYREAEEKVHRPDLWRDDGLLAMLSALDQSTRMRGPQDYDGDRSNLH